MTKPPFSIQKHYQKMVSFCFYLFVCFFLLSAFSIYFNSSLLTKILYISEGSLIYIFINIFIVNSNPIRINDFYAISIVFTLIILTSILNSSNPGIINSYKLILYALTFLLSFTIFRKTSSINIKKTIPSSVINFLCFFPLCFVNLFTNYGSNFFPDSNIMIFFAFAVCALHYIYYKNKILTLLIFLCYLFSGKTIGPLVMFCLAAFILYFRFSRRFIIPLLIGCIIFYLLLYYSDITIFIRLRNVISILSHMSYYDLFHLHLVEYGDIVNISQNVNVNTFRNDDTSFLFRIIKWSSILEIFFTLPIENVLFGCGDANFLADSMAPHNDYLWFLTHYGLLFLCFVIVFFYRIFQKVKEIDHFLCLFCLSALLYYFTENLITNFPSNVIFYFSLGLFINLKKDQLTKSIPHIKNL